MGGRVRGVDGGGEGGGWEGERCGWGRGRGRGVDGRVRGVDGRGRGVGIQTHYYVRRVETQRATVRYAQPHDSAYRLSHM